MTLDFAQLATTITPTAAILVFMWLNRTPTAKEKAEDPAKQLLSKLDLMERRDISNEERLIEMHADLQILKDRNKR